MTFLSVALAAEATTASVSPVAAVAGNFGLNLKLFLAQLVNFALLVVVLWRLLYRPLLAFLEERQQRIAEGLENATCYEEKLKALEIERQAVLTRTDAEARAIVAAASEEAETVKGQAREAAEAESQAIRERGQREASEAKTRAMADVRAAAADLVVLAAEKVLQTRLDEAADRRLIEQTLREL